MSTQSLTIVMTAVIFNALAQLFLKAGAPAISSFYISSEGFIEIAFKILTNVHIIAGLICCVLGLAVWMVALSRLEVSIAYPLLSIGYVINAIGAHYLFNESLTIEKFLGIGIILIGVFVLARS
jgi:multidrug transporter EmrE-like cation transporter